MIVISFLSRNLRSSLKLHCHHHQIHTSPSAKTDGELMVTVKLEVNPQIFA